MMQTYSLSERAHSLLRRLGAMVYDGLLLVALMMVPSVLLVAVKQGAITPGTVTHHAYQALLVLIIAAFYVISWTRRRQTLGMRAWQLEVRRDDGRALGAPRALLRLFASVVSFVPLGLGYLWILVDPRGLALHDRLTGTHIAHRANS